MCKSKIPRFSAHLLHLALFSKFVSKKRENLAISEDFSEYRRKKVLIAANHFYMLYRFRRELIEELQSRYEVIVAAPFQTGEEVFESMGIRCTETKMQRRRVQVLSELRLLQAYKRVLCLEKPDLVLTYAIKPNVYMGFLCTCYRIPFYATVQGLGSAFQRPWLSCAATFLYKLSFLRVQNVFFENQSNAVEFCRRHILPPEKEVVLHGAGVDLNRYIYTPYTAHDPPRFLFVGRLMREKGVALIFVKTHVCSLRIICKRMPKEGGKPHMVLLTVFTPTYNRAHTLPEAYCSLKAQTSKNFLWLIVDDGSTDRTAALVSAWMQAEKAFAIRYLYRPNGGMHAAHNTAYAHIETELNLCLDSDDRLAKDAVEQIEKRWAQIKSKNYAGLIGLDDDGNGKLIGTGFPPGLTETTLSGYYAGGGKGDKKLVYRTDIIRKYPPYPEFPNEKYVALAAKYRLIDRDYKLAVLNRVLCHVTYLEDGSSHTMWKQYAKNPRGFLYWRQLCLTYPAAATRTVLDSIHYDAACFLAKEPALMLRSPKKMLTMLCTPLGAGLSVLIRLMAARTERKAQKEAV